MANQRLSGAAGGAAQGASVAGPWGAVIGGVVGALTAGGGTDAQGVGLRAKGTISRDGFKGDVYGLASNAGENYEDLLTPNWAPFALLSAKAKQAFESVFGAESDYSFDINYVGPLTETGGNYAFSDSLVNEIKSLGRDTSGGALGQKARIEADIADGNALNPTNIRGDLTPPFDWTALLMPGLVIAGILALIFYKR